MCWRFADAFVIVAAVLGVSALLVLMLPSLRQRMRTAPSGLAAPTVMNPAHTREAAMIAGLKRIAVALGLIVVLVPAGHYIWRWYDRSRDVQTTMTPMSEVRSPI
jgi:hypothetical protein